MINKIIREELIKQKIPVERMDQEVERIAFHLTPLLLRIFSFNEIHLLPVGLRGDTRSSLGHKAIAIQDQSPYSFKEADHYYGIHSKTMICFERIIFSCISSKGTFHRRAQTFYLGGFAGDRDFPVYCITRTLPPSTCEQFVSALMGRIVVEERHLDPPTLLSYINEGLHCMLENNIDKGVALLQQYYGVAPTSLVEETKEEMRVVTVDSSLDIFYVGE